MAPCLHFRVLYLKLEEMARKAAAKLNGEAVKGGKVAKKANTRSAKKKEESPPAEDQLSQEDLSEKEETTETAEPSKSTASNRSNKSAKNVQVEKAVQKKKEVEDDVPDVVEPVSEKYSIGKRDGISVSKTNKEVLPRLIDAMNDVLNVDPDATFDVITFLTMVTEKLNHGFPILTNY
uniref:Uncharacterized protein n=1 Tax=Panagrolaimus sp. JU765 TaxID=591449 RepID=A0AC34QY32_9BILA